MSAYRLPVAQRVGNNGRYGLVRKDSTHGACPSGYPCTHWGTDLAAVPGTRVVSPVTGRVVYSVGDLAPFKGFGPHIVVIEDSDAGERYRYHLIGHLDYKQSRGFFGDNHAGGWPTRIATPVKAGQVVGVIGGYRHIHWQVQSRPYQQGATWSEITQDPLAWATRKGAVWMPPQIVPEDYVGAAVAFATALLATKGLG